MFHKVSEVLLPKSAILLDVDGVMVDWSSSCFRVCGVDPEVGYARWKPGSFEITEALGMNEELMWEHIEREGSAFWSELEAYPWARALYDHCLTIAPTYFVTSPSNNPTCHVGKVEWMQKFTGDSKFRNYMLGPAKHICANSKHVLVDDYDRNVNKFNEAGGSTILFPQYWNANSALKADPFPYVKAELEKWIQGQFEQAARLASQTESK